MDELLLEFLKDNMITMGLVFSILKALAMNLNLSKTNSILDSIWGGVQAVRGNGSKKMSPSGSGPMAGKQINHGESKDA